MQKFNFQPSLAFGNSEQAAGVEQNYLNPTLGVSYTYDPKLSFFGSIGMDIRRTTSTTESGEEEEFTETAPTFELGTSWQVNQTTSLGLSIYRRSLASALEGQSSSDTTGITVFATKAFPRGFVTSLDYSLENSSYTDIRGVESDPGAEDGGSGTPENYHRFSFSIGRQKLLRGRMPLSVSLFYQYSLSTGSNPLNEFEQSVVGFRVGLAF
jgi:predicted porin